jgi:hypothetical protein
VTPAFIGCVENMSGIGELSAGSAALRPLPRHRYVIDSYFEYFPIIDGLFLDCSGNFYAMVRLRWQMGATDSTREPGPQRQRTMN